ncbi:hypothetical protein [Cellvibrio japonicus]|uniref:Uncharacterized protein n=1 Tax=Cellvibrio japonicus (strain Ueda107) TaxID=498211 RepID=B3PKY8_CELJU|nr:hypothetical protein [Cellvibrio japonicus]ACE83939.1 hypothetical protein CJA_2501 [Cellvibrio japonicus Ueda107]QEI12890.1 hypothetical protein FY117_12070 [Cellvibrio japonicus]QEI16464.1 hypothetical protein FY116_12075 [Cellvibrio japonicus]QEI20042.1 hypothetical protein FY115_12070 [Cellvibrio japonicus]
MIDLSITKDPEWIKRREALWKPIGESLSEGLRKKEVEKVHHYFMTGTLRDGEEMSDGAKFYWFPIQTPEAWDYIFEHMFDTKEAASEFEKIFYFQFGDMSGRALDESQELAMWDYFAGEIFRPVIASRVPVGKEKKIVGFDIDYGKIAAKFSLGIKGWLSGLYANEPKWITKINYFSSYLEQLPDNVFEKDDEGEFIHRAAKIIKSMFKSIIDCQSQVGSLDGDALEARMKFLTNFPMVLDSLVVSNEIKELWQEAKKGNQ